MAPGTELTAVLADGFRRFEEPELAPLRVWLLRAWRQRVNAETPEYTFALRDLASELRSLGVTPSTIVLTLFFLPARLWLRW